MSRRAVDADPTSDLAVTRLAAGFEDQLSRLEVLELESQTLAVLRGYARGEVSDAALSKLTELVAELRAALKRSAIAARRRTELELKFSPDQPRDEQGRWTGGGDATTGREVTASKRGQLSMVHETGDGPGQEAAAAGRVSSGQKDKGGVSYGAYQLSSKTGQVQAFLKSSGSQWASEFDGQDPTERGGTFGQTWKAIAARDPVAFFNAQEHYIAATHYSPVVRSVLRATGLDINSRPLAVQQVVWSMAVQHGGAAKIIRNAVDDLDQWTDPSEPGYDSALINNLYDFRSQYVVNRRVENLVNIISSYSDERKRALSLLGG